MQAEKEMSEIAQPAPITLWAIFTLSQVKKIITAFYTSDARGNFDYFFVIMLAYEILFF